MVLGGGASSRSTDLDATLPYNVAASALQQEEFGDTYEDVEDGGNEVTTHYTNAQALGLATLEMSCGEGDTKERRAGRHHLDTVNSAGQNGANTLHGSSCGGQRQTDRVTPIWSSASDVEVSGSIGDSRSVKMDERLRKEDSAAYCGKSPQRLLKEIYAQVKAEQLRTSAGAIGDEKTGCPAITGFERVAKNMAGESNIEEFQPPPSAVQRLTKNAVKNAAEKKMSATEDRLHSSEAKGSRNDRPTKSLAAAGNQRLHSEADDGMNDRLLRAATEKSRFQAAEFDVEDAEERMATSGAEEVDRLPKFSSVIGAERKARKTAGKTTEDEAEMMKKLHWIPLRTAQEAQNAAGAAERRNEAQATQRRNEAQATRNAAGGAERRNEAQATQNAAGGAERRNEAQATQWFNTQTAQLTDEENIRTSLPVTIGPNLGARSKIRRTEVVNTGENNAQQLDSWVTAVTEAIHTTSGRQNLLPVPRNVEKQEVLAQKCRMKKMESVQSNTRLRRVNSDVSMYDETTERQAVLNSTARDQQNLGEMQQEAPKSRLAATEPTIYDMERWSAALTNATQVANQLMALSTAADPETGNTPMNTVTSARDLRRVEEQHDVEERRTPDSVLLEESLHGTRTPSPNVDFPQSGRSSAGSSVSQRHRHRRTAREAAQATTNSGRNCYNIQEVSPSTERQEREEAEDTDRRSTGRTEDRQNFQRR